jgi:hypothetical protein
MSQAIDTNPTTVQDVRVLVGKTLGLSESDSMYPGNIDPETRIKLFDLTNAWIKDHPENFSTQQVKSATAMNAAWGTNTPLQDTSFSYGDFAGEVGNNIVAAGEDFASVGQGVLNTLKMGKWLIPTVAVVVLLIVLYGFYLKRTK